ncbi:MAG: FAD-dependent oxidoreductase, partial [Gemmatimonadetes bacterium]|nr:FAD-dependent oxidoreductase [Gemmatimonadota bacterium]
KEWGATVLTKTEFVAATSQGDRGWDVTLRGGCEETVSARAIVNAAGPWVNGVAERIRPAPETRPIDLVQGAHVVVPGSPGDSIYYLEAPSDGRAVFAMPWGSDTLVGTTETVHTGSPETAAPTPEEERYLLDVFTHYFPAHANGGEPAVLGSFAGLRVLPATGDSPFRRSRETGIVLDCASGAPCVSIYGGKLTTWRVAASRVLDRLVATGALGLKEPREPEPSLD